MLLLNTESMDRETANTSKLGGSNHKRITSNPTNYVKVQNAEVSSAGTADPTFQGGFPATNNYTTAGQNSRGNGIPHTLGNSLGGNPKQSLNMSNYVLTSNGKKIVYELYAVSNHFGSLHGGHYTAFAKNPIY